MSRVAVELIILAIQAILRMKTESEQEDAARRMVASLGVEAGADAAFRATVNALKKA